MGMITINFSALQSKPILKNIDFSFVLVPLQRTASNNYVK